MPERNRPVASTSARAMESRAHAARAIVEAAGYQRALLSLRHLLYAPGGMTAADVFAEAKRIVDGALGEEAGDAR